MADVSGIINAIEAAIYTNGAELITGDILQAVLETMVNGLNTLKEDTLTFDNTPTNGSDNPVKSGGIYAALENKQNTLVDGDNISTINGESLLTGDPITINASKSETVVGSLGESLFLKISQAAPHSFRIDINAKYNSTPNTNLIGSLIVAVCYDAGWQSEAYYYGSTLADLVRKVAIYEADGDFYLVVSLKSQDLTEPFYFTVVPLDENTLDASVVEIDTQTLVETITPTELGAGGGGGDEQTSNKKTDIPANRDSEAYYPNTKGVFDLTSKWGIKSHTRSWTTAADGAKEYNITNPTWGTISNALVERAADYGVNFNGTSGYFEVNDLTDISEEEMRYILTYGIIGRWIVAPDVNNCFYNYNGLTIILGFNFSAAVVYSTGQVFYNTQCRTMVCGKDWAFKFRAGNCGYTFMGNPYLVSIKPTVDVSAATISNSTFAENPSLEYVQVYGAKQSFGFNKSVRLQPACVAYAINNIGTTSPITITLHATAYAAANADAAVTTALAAHTNVSLASA